MLTIEDALRVQRDLKLDYVHVAYIDPDEGFVMAHTDAERQLTAENPLCPLHSCWAHLWLTLLCPVHEAGWYTIGTVFDIPVLSGLAL